MRRILTGAALLGAALLALAAVSTSQPATPVTHAAPPVAQAAAHRVAPVTEQECRAPQKTPPTQPQKLPPVTIQVHGVQGADVSEYEGAIDWTKLSAQKEFVIMRFSHGAHLDTEFVNFFKSAKQTGVIRGVYHYVDPADPYPFADQLRRFVKGVKLEKGDLAPIIDLENPCLWVHLSDSDRMKYVMKWANALEKVYGVKPIVYLSPLFVDKALGGATNADVLKNYPLWIANYRVVRPTVPLPWTSYIMWQYGEDIPLAGVSIPADGDVAPGSLSDLQKYTLQQDAGGDDSVLTAQDLDDEGLTKKH